MPLDRPYYVVENGTAHHYDRTVTEYAIKSSADGTLVTGTDLVFMHKVIDLLNEDADGKDVHR
jgi:hypothetical protein